VHEGRNGNAGALASMPVAAWLDDCADALSFAIIGALNEEPEFRPDVGGRLLSPPRAVLGSAS